MATVEITALVPIVIPRAVSVARSALRDSALQAIRMATTTSRGAFIGRIVTTRRPDETCAAGPCCFGVRLAGLDAGRGGGVPARDASRPRFPRRLRRREAGRDEPRGPRRGFAHLRPQQP